MTICWHVNGLKVSHKGPAIVSAFLLKLVDIYGEKITVTGGKVHDYLGMDLDYTKKGVLQVSMIKYLTKVLTIFRNRLLVLLHLRPQITYSRFARAMESKYYLKNRQCTSITQ